MGHEVVMVNSNPETVSTDFDTSDMLFFEPLTHEDVMNIVERVRPKGVTVQFGDETPLNLARGLHDNGAPLVGTSVESILSNYCSGSDIVTPLNDFKHNRNEEGEFIHRAMDAEDYKEIGQHVDAETIRARLPAELWNSYFKVSLARNPWDRAVSFFYWEHALNIFRTTAPGDTLLADGDNHFFPLVYGHLVERMREDTVVYDRLNLLFKMIPALRVTDISPGEWLRVRAERETTIIENAHPRNVFFVVFDPASILMPAPYKVTVYCLLHRVMEREEAEKPHRVSNLWRYYATESFYEPFTRDFMNRQDSRALQAKVWSVSVFQRKLKCRTAIRSGGVEHRI